MTDNTQYRILEPNEIIRKGDEVNRPEDLNIWDKVISSVGHTTASFFTHHADVKVRRRITP
jgi:hypothetical protein